MGSVLQRKKYHFSMDMLEKISISIVFSYFQKNSNILMKKKIRFVVELIK